MRHIPLRVSPTRRRVTQGHVRRGSVRAAGPTVRVAFVGACMALWSLPRTTDALTIEYALQGTGAGTKMVLLVKQAPAAEPFAAVKIQASVRAGVDVTQLIVRAPESGSWSQVTPAVSRSGATIRITALAPDIRRFAGSDPLVVLYAEVSLGSSAASCTDVFDSVWVVTALDPAGSAINGIAAQMTATGARRLVKEGRTTVSYRSQGRMHSLSFSLLKQLPVKALVTNAQGKVVRNLVNTRMQAGMHVVAWDGRDGRGSFVPSGMYFIQLETGTTVLNKKVRCVQ